MIDVSPHSSCVGCHACESQCGQDAIQMFLNDEGFLYPRVDNEKCTHCGECLTVCPGINEVQFERLPSPDVYAAWSNDDDIIKNSSSGGVFSELALKMLGDHGVVIGAAFDEYFHLVHQAISSEYDLPRLRGSKYLQSNLAKIFAQIQPLLEENKKVLFSGTPCQVAGLNSFLKRDYPNLLTCDLVCHGVASPGVFARYIQEIQEKHQSRIIDFKFRTKPRGWKNFFCDIQFANDACLSMPFSENSFMKGYLADIYLRPCCYACNYSRLPRVADITLGDFWGIWNHKPEWDDDRGTSVILVNSVKGRQFLSQCDLTLKPAKLEWVIEGNPMLTSAVKPHKKRKKFFKLFRAGKNFEAIINICLPPATYFDKLLWSINRRLKRLTQ